MLNNTTNEPTIMLNHLADFCIWIYTLNRKTFQLRGDYRLLKAASAILPKLQRYPISFEGSGICHADVRDPDSYWLLNAHVGDIHQSLSHLVTILSKHVKAGSVVWDVGGSMGLFTIELLRSTLKIGAVHVFEPHPVPMRVAQALLETNDKVTLHPFALGDQSGTGHLFGGGKSGSGGSSLVSKQEEGITYEIQIKTGDGLVKSAGLPAPDIIKIDVEGFEPAVLRGMEQIIVQKQPVIALEILFLTSEQIQSILPPGYKIRYIRESDGELCEDYEDACSGGCMDALMEPIKPSA